MAPRGSSTAANAQPANIRRTPTLRRAVAERILQVEGRCCVVDVEGATRKDLKQEEHARRTRGDGREQRRPQSTIRRRAFFLLLLGASRGTRIAHASCALAQTRMTLRVRHALPSPLTSSPPIPLPTLKPRPRVAIAIATRFVAAASSPGLDAAASSDIIARTGPRNASRPTPLSTRPTTGSHRRAFGLKPSAKAAVQNPAGKGGHTRSYNGHSSAVNIRESSKVGGCDKAAKGCHRLEGCEQRRPKLLRLRASDRLD